MKHRLAADGSASAILPGMAAKPGITIVGAGNLANALASSLVRAGFRIEGIVTRPMASSVSRGRMLAREVNSRVISLSEVKSHIVWFCVPDSQIAHVARSLASAIEWRGRIALHSSGALTSDALAVLRRRGAAVASAHPLMTFVHDSKPSLTGVPFAIEGDPRAVRVARSLVKALRAEAFTLHKRDKASYHAWATFTSPLLTAFLETAEHAAAAAGIPSRLARRRSLTIMARTFANYAAFGAAKSLSGPIARGDTETIKGHLRVLRRRPVEREVYLALARASLRYLPAKNRKELAELLKA